MPRALVLPALFIVFGCSRSAPRDFWLMLAAAPGSGVRFGDTAVSPPGALLERRAERRGVALRLRADLGPVRVSAPGGCPLVIEAPKTPGAVERSVAPLFDLGPPVRVVGPEQRFEVRAIERCPDAKHAKVALRVGKGAPLDDVRLENGGRTLSAKTRGAERVEGRVSFGIVPVSAERRSVTEIVARIELSDGMSFERMLEVAALARASGLPSVAVGHPILLAGTGFRLEKKPEGSRAELRSVGELTELVPDARGDFALADALGRKLVIQSGRYDEMPLDCGRSDCHGAITFSVARSPMTQALAADLGGRHPLGTPECALACHATGEPGTKDGGFSHVQEELELDVLPAVHAELPRALRRLGGVGCLACHGPARVPPDDARWAVLRSDVCAVCHDAPPRYGHVAAFATSRMARADGDRRTRERPECERCHTTHGSLGEPARRPPEAIGSLGLGCAACHDVHPTDEARQGGIEPALLRDVDVLAALPGAPMTAGGPSRVCVACHSPGAGELPEASAAAIWSGRGGVDPETGAELVGPSPHATDMRGCVRCHDAGPKELERGASHAFRAGPSSCAPCHAEAPKRRPELAVEARALLDELVPLARGVARSSPPHAETSAPRLPKAKARALRNALLVLEDPAADVHNPEYAELLLAASRPTSKSEKAANQAPSGAQP